MAVYAFTSIAKNYLPKARALSTSLKSKHPDWKFVLLVAEDVSVETKSEYERKTDIDEIISFRDLPIRTFDGEILDTVAKAQWMFKHSLVEACTAVKGSCLELLLNRKDADAVFYFDPDMVVMNELSLLIDSFEKHSILLTPHVAHAEDSIDAILDNELSSLVHGVYNLGFIGVKADDVGRQLASWWRRRLDWGCYDEKEKGIFTDQRWVDLVPACFDRVGILRYPGFNVATWNLTQREVGGSLASGVTVNGEPLCFYHFSGFDSGAQLAMLNKYGSKMPVLYEMRDWYIAQCAHYEDSQLSRVPWQYAKFSNGATITKAHRRLYRDRIDLQRAFTEPFNAEGSSYYSWCSENPDEL